jgi:hypothetical protein
VIGKTAISKILAGATAGTVNTIQGTHTVPDQVINLLQIQLQKLSKRLESEHAKGQYACVFLKLSITVTVAASS